MEWIDSLHWEGILIGICTFLIIGLFHPIVVKAEYYWGTRCWWIFLLLGIAGLIGSVLVSQILLSTLLGVFSFSSFWTIEDIENDIVPYVEKVTGDSDVQATKVEGTTQVTIKTRTLSLDERQELEDTLAENCDVDASTITSQSISSTISGEMRSDALKAVIVSCIFMLLYIWFRFKDVRFATSAVLALLHDVLVVLAFYAVSRISVGAVSP